MLPQGHPHYHGDGKVFKLHEVGSVGMEARARVVKPDLAEWDDCLACEEFTHCYQLCMARLALETIVNHE
jgi:hypothetical protein